MNRQQKQFMKIIKTIDYSRQNWEKFYDFCELTSQSFRVCLSPYHDLVSKDIERIHKKYKKEDITKFDKMLDCMIESLEISYHDFLGDIFQEMELHNKYKGQFFTPYPVCKMMSQMTLGTNIKESFNESGYFTCNDPACGAGATLIAVVDELVSQGHNPSTDVYMVAQDVDQLASYMCYIQLSLCGVAAKIVHGNTLSGEIFSEWYTPVYFLNGWYNKIKIQESKDETNSDSTCV